MMRKFSKILALVLAFAMVLCPVLTAAAETESEVLYSSAVLDANITAAGATTATLAVETVEDINAIDFKINLAKGVSFDPETDTVTINADESGDAAAWSVATSYADGVLSVLAVDGDNMANVATYLVFDITLTVDNAADYDFYLTKIYAVGAGSADTDEVICVFPYADNDQSGVIDVEAARTGNPDYFVSNICAHTNVNTVTTDATCTEAGSTVVTCADCGYEVSNTPIEALGHNYAGTIDGAYVTVVEPTEGAVGYAVYNAICDNGCGTWNDAYYNEDGSVKADVDFAALVAAGDPNVEELPALEVPCETATEWSKDETGHWYDCTCGEQHDFAEHTEGDAVEVERVEATAGVAGYYVTVVNCSVCNYEISRTTTEIPALPVGPEVDDALVIAGASVGYGESSLQIGFRVRKTVINLYDKVELVIIPQKYDLTTLNLAETEETVVELVAGGTFTTYTYTDIQLYELGLNVEYLLRAYTGDELVAVSQTYTTSAASYLKNAFSTSTEAKFRTLVTDTLVVGQEAVEMMAASYPDSDLAAATSIIEGFDISEATADYGTLNTVDEFTSYNTSFTTATSATHRVMKSVSIGKVPYIGFRIKDANSALDTTKISFSVAYTSLKLDGSTAAYSKTFDSTNTTFSKAGQFITFSFDEIGLGDSDKDLAIEIYYDGEKVCDMTYSIESYLSGMTSNASIGEICTALLKLGAGFRAYATK